MISLSILPVYSLIIILPPPLPLRGSGYFSNNITALREVLLPITSHLERKKFEISFDISTVILDFAVGVAFPPSLELCLNRLLAYSTRTRRSCKFRVTRTSTGSFEELAHAFIAILRNRFPWFSAPRSTAICAELYTHIWFCGQTYCSSEVQLVVAPKALLLLVVHRLKLVPLLRAPLEPKAGTSSLKGSVINRPDKASSDLLVVVFELAVKCGISLSAFWKSKDFVLLLSVLVVSLDSCRYLAENGFIRKRELYLVAITLIQQSLQPDKRASSASYLVGLILILRGTRAREQLYNLHFLLILYTLNLYGRQFIGFDCGFPEERPKPTYPTTTTTYPPCLIY